MDGANVKKGTTEWNAFLEKKLSPKLSLNLRFFFLNIRIVNLLTLYYFLKDTLK